MEEIARRFKKIRHMQEKNQSEWANFLNISLKAVGNYEKGIREIPQSVFLKLTELGYSIEWLLTGKGDMKIQDVEFVPEDDGSAPDYENEGMIKDPGLDELLSPANRGKFLITEDEAKELRGLAFRRKSQTTLQQWVSLLYMLREMNNE